MADPKQSKPYALYKRGELHYIGMHTDEADCWKVALGWPSPEEIEWAKKNEATICLPVRVTALRASGEASNG